MYSRKKASSQSLKGDFTGYSDHYAIKLWIMKADIFKTVCLGILTQIGTENCNYRKTIIKLQIISKCIALKEFVIKNENK